GLVAFRLRHDEVMRVGRFCRRVNFLLRRIEAPELDVLQNGVVKQEGILRDEPDLLAERALGQGTQIVSIDPDDSGCWIVETQDERKNGALAGSAGADQRITLTRLDSQVEISHCVLFSAAVAKGDS